MFLDRSNGFCLDTTPISFGEAWSLTWELKFQFLARNGYNELKRYEKHLEREIGALPLDKITPLLIEQFRAKYLHSGMKSQSVAHILGLIRRVFNYVIKLNLYHGNNPASKVKMPKEDNGNNPASKVKMPKEDNSRHRFLTKEEAQLLLDTLKEKSQQVWKIALLSLTTGMRAGEVFSMRGEHVDLRGKTIRVVDPKNGKNRTVYPSKTALTMLRSCKLKPGRYVFTQANGKQIKAISDTFPRTVEALGLNEGITDSRDKIVFHSLRHTFASWMVQCDQTLYFVAELMGHSTLEMTKRYAHLSPTRQQAAATIIDSFV